MNLYFIYGCMFSGKSKYIFDYIDKHKLQQQDYKCFKPSLHKRDDFFIINTRYHMDFRKITEKLTQHPYNFKLVEIKNKSNVNDLTYLEKGNLKIYETSSIFKNDKFYKKYDRDLDYLLFLVNE